MATARALCHCCWRFRETTSVMEPGVGPLLGTSFLPAMGHVSVCRYSTPKVPAGFRGPTHGPAPVSSLGLLVPGTNTTRSSSFSRVFSFTFLTPVLLRPPNSQLRAVPSPWLLHIHIILLLPHLPNRAAASYFMRPLSALLLGLWKLFTAESHCTLWYYFLSWITSFPLELNLSLF